MCVCVCVCLYVELDVSTVYNTGASLMDFVFLVTRHLYFYYAFSYYVSSVFGNKMMMMVKTLSAERGTRLSQDVSKSVNAPTLSGWQPGPNKRSK